MSARQFIPILKQAAADWSDDRATRLSAALAYYTMLSIAPLLVIAVKVVGLWYRNADDARENVTGYLQQFMGSQSAQALEMMTRKAGEPGSGTMATIISFFVLLFSAGGVFGELQDSMNVVWEVQPKPGRGWMDIVRQRFFSLSLVLGTAFLLLVSLIANTVLASVVSTLGIGWFWSVVNFCVSLVVIAGLFTAIYKFLPDVKVPWKPAFYGGVLAAVLFTIGRILLAWYLGRGSTTSVYGAAGSLAALLIWTYYSGLILFFGAEFTQAIVQGVRPAIPKPTAEKVPESPQAYTRVPVAVGSTNPPTRQSQSPFIVGALSLAAGAVLGGVGAWLTDRHAANIASTRKLKPVSRRSGVEEARACIREIVRGNPILESMDIEKTIQHLQSELRR